ncbi:Rpn family recombination-promoting nuclease/putative transposase [Anaerolineales bacterium HSG6]|nr:Rpn family recombination-promoting nuclease/putative transposase [Anaerolineales bacterium HSG6]MDM8532193.1 Rpn family recombination-promoting nuclease/putative transposase [Anaerolineales bacterium HSG25]
MSNKNGAKVIRFDWAIKNILRDKANFDILEGFLTALLEEDIQVLGLLDTESNQDTEQLKYNRVDILIQDSEERHIIVEVQNERESDYLYRLLFGTSKVIIDTLELGQPYREIAKVISISILYFNLGSGDDYVYYGKTSFQGIHTKQPLMLRRKKIIEDKKYILRQVSIEKEIFPEYYLIQVERFEDKVNVPLDEWIYMLKHDVVRDDFNAKNIDKAREKLLVLNMDQEKRRQYEKYLMNVASERDIMETAREEGHKEGHKEGRKEGHKDSARQMLADGLPLESIAKYTTLSVEDIMAIDNEGKSSVK